jgi:DNA-binding transcriptional LysR family regulator
MTIELRLLNCAIKLAEHRNFARAAVAVCVSQPTLTRNIQEIERRVGTQLFERGRDGVVPTDAGKIFLDQAREVVARSVDLSREMDILRGLERGELNIGAETYPSAMFVDRAVVQLLSVHPSVRLQIRTDNRERLLPLLRKRALDLIVVAAGEIEVEPELHITRLNQHQAYFVVRNGHPLSAPKLVPTVHDILQFPVVMTSRFPVSLLKQFLTDEKHNTNHPTAKSFPAIACESVAMMKVIVAGTDTVSLLPLNVVSDEIQTGQLVVLSIVPPTMKVDFGIVRLARRSLSPLGETFVRLVHEVDAELLAFEQKNAPKFLAPSVRIRAKARAATGAG